MTIRRTAIALACLAAFAVPAFADDEPAAKETKTERRSAPFCPVSTNKCASCHMPKVELAGMHAQFTDHWIRIVKPGEPTPR